MPLPTPDQLRELHKRLELAKAGGEMRYGFWPNVQDRLLKQGAEGLGVAGTVAVEKGVTHLVGVAQVSMGMAGALAPVGAALTPWILAAQIAWQADGAYSFYDLRNYAKSKYSRYPCTCGKCLKGLEYILRRYEMGLNKKVIAGITLGAAYILYIGPNSLVKSFLSGRPKEMHSRQFVESARQGCICALATIMKVCGDWPQNKPAKKSQFIDPITIILADDGWKLLRNKM